MAGAVITAAPIVIIFALLQKYFVQTVVGSVKG
jgi:ABC-type glycerol-3-phosphate transport system permease component